jgi:NADH dehydrogenase FAD-containing subunit
MSQKQRVVIIGGGYAGVLAALRLAPQQVAEVTLVNARENFTQRIRLHQQLAGQTPRQYSLTKLLRGKKVNLMLGTVTQLNPVDKIVSVQQGDNVQHIAYDILIYAAGSVVNKDGVPGVRDHAFTLDAASVAHMAGRLPELAQRGGKLWVLGGGLTGIEAATELAESYPGLQITLLTRSAIGAGLSVKGRNYIRQTLSEFGITLIEQTAIQAVRAEGVVTESGGFLAADACLWTGGFTPAPLARDSGVLVNAQGQIIIDETLRSISHPDIFAAGDSAGFAPETGLKMRMACATAMPMGAVAGGNVGALLIGKPLQPMNFAYLVQCMSLGRQRGLLQFVNADDTPQEKIITGYAGALAKEMICQYTTLSLRLERWLPGSYIVPKGKVAQRALIAQPQG